MIYNSSEYWLCKGLIKGEDKFVGRDMELVIVCSMDDLLDSYKLLEEYYECDVCDLNFVYWVDVDFVWWSFFYFILLYRWGFCLLDCDKVSDRVEGE